MFQCNFRHVFYTARSTIQPMGHTTQLGFFRRVWLPEFCQYNCERKPIVARYTRTRSCSVGVFVYCQRMICFFGDHCSHDINEGAQLQDVLSVEWKFRIWVGFEMLHNVFQCDLFRHFDRVERAIIINTNRPIVISVLEPSTTNIV